VSETILEKQYMEEQQEQARFIIGIDLGTTNSAVSFVDTSRKPFKVEDFPVLQLISPGETAALPIFPSFHYEAAESEFRSGSLNMPWDSTSKKTVCGSFARDHGAQVSARLVASVKSWLSHSGVDRTADLLPWHGAADVEKISPVQATARYLSHIRQAWNYSHPDDPIESQDVVITVPASFDEIARELTVTAASQAGIPKIVLLEEPQAAFYAWIYQHSKNWQSQVNPGQKILICDIGGGTTDFTLIQVRPAQDPGSVQFHRVAVGDHLILGGDNLDLALAYYIESEQLGGKRLVPRQFGSLLRNCQRAKESLLGDNPPQKMSITIQSFGSSLIGGSIQTEITQDKVKQILLEGFFPFVDLTEKPKTRQSGFQEFGLPYASDPAVTRHLAAFLTAHRNGNTQLSKESESDPARPDIVLFNGGVLASAAIRQRIIDVLKKWFSTAENPWEPVLFENEHPELAVARGASYFGMVRRGLGVRITAGLARSYYIGVQSGEETMALCLAPAGLQEGQSIDLSNRTFDLLIRQPVEFPLFVSSFRTTDKPGDLVVIDSLEMSALPPISTVLRSGRKMEADMVKVMLHTRLTEIGTLDLWCTEVTGNRSWKLQFDVRSATRTDLPVHEGIGEQMGFVDSTVLSECRDIIIGTFCPKQGKTEDPSQLMKKLEQKTGMDRNAWPPSLLRSLWEILLEVESGRSIDPLHEVRWLNFMGFSLRPGYGYAVDDWRVKQSWFIFQKGVIHSRNQACRSEWWIFWRRIAGGLTSGQQHTLAQNLIASLRAQFTDSKKKVKTDRYGVHELAEIWRLLASLEYLKVSLKEEIAGIALEMIVNRSDSLVDAGVWAIGRLGTRVPVYGPLNELVSSETAASWAQQLISSLKPTPSVMLSLMQLCRKTNDRYRDIDEESRCRVLEYMKKYNAGEHFIELVKSGGFLDEEDQSRIFGEQLPKGLRII
jgi:molecular chaperone DnaK (HSP70)